MVVFYRCLVALVVLTISITAYADDSYVVSGSAYNLKTGKLVYRELIGKLNENEEVHINYVKPNGVIFARKTLNYETEVFQPGVILQDERNNEVISEVFEAGRLVLTHKLKGDVQTKTLYETSKLIIDAGVDAYIQQQWVKITAGNKIEFDVADARHMGVEKHVIKLIDAAASPLAYKGADKTWVYFRVDTANKLSSLFSEPMYYAYKPNGKYLMRYQGRANIDDNNGDAWSVRIEYEYF